MNTNYFILSNLNKNLDKLDDDLEFLFFVSEIVDGTFKYFNIERNIAKTGRPPADLKKIIKLLYWASINKIESTVEIAKNNRNNILYKILTDGEEYSDRTLRKYRHYFYPIYQLILSYILIVAETLGFSKFNHISVDGTIKKANNSKYNIIKAKDISLLIRHYMVCELTKKEIKKLRRSARKFLENDEITDKEKVDILFYWWHLLDLTNQTSLALNDNDARWMITKDTKTMQLSYNIQIGVDTESKLIVAIQVVQSPTDHYQIPIIVNQIIENNHPFGKLTADNIYLTDINIQYLKQHGITAYIPSRKQSKEMIGKLNENPYHKDHFNYNTKKDVYICPEGQELTLDGEYKASPEKGGYERVQLTYSNYFACKNCSKRIKCTKTKHRTITQYTNKSKREIWKIMETEEGKEEYKKRSKTVEAPNGTFKNIYHFNSIPINGLENVQGIMFIIASSYNAIRLFHLIKENKLKYENVINVIKWIN